MPQVASNPYLPLVAQLAQKAGIDPKWAQATLLTENAPGNPQAVSPAGAQGLMQVLPTSAPGVPLTDPVSNLTAGVNILAQNLKAAGGDKSKASAMYFDGPNAKTFGPNAYQYVQKVADNYNALGNNQVATPQAPAQSGPDPMADLGAFLSSAPNTAQSPGAQGGAQSSSDPMADLGAFLQEGQPPVTPQDTSPIIAAAGRGMAGRLASQVNAAQAPVTGALARIGGAAVGGAEDAFGNAPLGMSGQTQTGLSQAGIYPPQKGGGTPMQYVNKAVGDTVAPAVDLVARGAGALLGGAQAGVAQTGTELGAPLLGRDAAALPEAFAGDSALLKEGEAKEDGVTPNLLTAPDKVTPNVGEPLSTPKPQSVGAAATPAEITKMTPAEAASNEAAANLHNLTSSPKPGDATIYVPGSIPTKAEIAADPNISLEQKQHAQTIAPAEFAAVQKRNNDARIDLYQSLAGNPDSLRIAEDQREANQQQGYAAAFANKGTTDATPVLNTIDSILSSPAGKQKAVVETLNDVKKGLYDANGNLETDPEMLYGVRKNINDLLSKKGALANPTAQLATSQLMEIKNALDQAIEPAAPGFGKYISDYADASRPIDTMEYLQSQAPRLMSGGTMSYPKFNQFMQNVAKQRTMPGANPAKSIDPETLQQLWNIHADLKRTTNLDLGKARGSDTAQNFSVMGKIGGTAAHSAAHVAASHLLGPFGNLTVEGAKTILGARKAAQTQKAIAARTNLLLNPSEVYGSGGETSH